MDFPLEIGVHLWNRDDVVELGALGGLNISVTTIALALLYLSRMIGYVASPSRNPVTLRYSRPLTIYMGIVAASVLVAQDITLTFFEVGLLIQLFFLFLYVSNWLCTREDILFCVRFLLIGLVMEGALMMWLVWRGSGLELVGMRARLDTDDGVTGLARVGGSIGSPNSAAAYLSVLLAMAASTLVSAVSSRIKILAVAAIVAGTVALVMTYSRGGFTAFLIGTGMVFLASFARNRAARKWILVAAIGLGSIFVALHSSMGTRFLGDDAGSAYSRVPLMRLAFKIIADHPLFGVGANNYVPAMEQYVSGEFRHQFLYVVHNKYLLIWAETGLVGLAVYVWFLLQTVRLGLRCWRRGDKLLSPLAFGLTAGLLGHMVQMFVEPFRGRPTVELVWLVAGLIYAIHTILFKRDSLERLRRITAR